MHIYAFDHADIAVKCNNVLHMYARCAYLIIKPLLFMTNGYNTLFINLIVIIRDFAFP